MGEGGKKWQSASEVLRPALLGQVPQGSENVTGTVEPSCSQKTPFLCSWRWISGGIHSSPSGSLKQLKHQIYLGDFLGDVWTLRAQGGLGTEPVPQEKLLDI